MICHPAIAGALATSASTAGKLLDVAFRGDDELHLAFGFATHQEEELIIFLVELLEDLIEERILFAG